MKIIEKEFNAITGEESLIERDATPNEIAELKKAELERQAIAKAQAKSEAKRQVALAKLAALGLEEDDLIALGL